MSLDNMEIIVIEEIEKPPIPNEIHYRENNRYSYTIKQYCQVYLTRGKDIFE